VKTAKYLSCTLLYFVRRAGGVLEADTEGELPPSSLSWSKTCSVFDKNIWI
jgi:hypothetical protein